MNDRRFQLDTKKVDTKELEFPETVYIRDIDNRVFQGIVLQILSGIEGITLIEGNLFDNLMGWSPTESVKGIHADQDMQNHTINIKVEVNVCYGICIPEKAEEIQTKIAEEVTKLTGLHVSSVHVVFKNVVPEGSDKINISKISHGASTKDSSEEDYSDEF